MEPAFAVWITGLPASGKSTLAQALRRQLAGRGLEAAVLESDALRRELTPAPRYDEDERALFYRALACMGGLLVEHGVPVIFDATANRRQYRAWARERIPRFMEAYVECPLDVCVARDPKGIYRAARAGAASTVPGLQAPYEAPERPDVIIQGAGEDPVVAARRVMALLQQRGYLPEGPP